VKAIATSHCAGEEVIPKAVRQEIVKAVEATAVTAAKGAATKIRDAILLNLVASGWSAETRISNGQVIDCVP